MPEGVPEFVALWLFFQGSDSGAGQMIDGIFHEVSQDLLPGSGARGSEMMVRFSVEPAASRIQRGR
jgi:hypothetical protein